MTMCQTQMDSRQRESESTPKPTPEGPLKPYEEGSLHPFDTQTCSKHLNSEWRNERLKSRETGVSDTKASGLELVCFPRPRILFALQI